MILAFELTMPRVNTWNGSWSGENKRYIKTKSFRGREERTAREKAGDYFYNFGDGWCANVRVFVVDSSEASKLRKKSAGFLGYDWMIDSILKNGKIETCVM